MNLQFKLHNSPLRVSYGGIFFFEEKLPWGIKSALYLYTTYHWESKEHDFLYPVEQWQFLTFYVEAMTRKAIRRQWPRKITYLFTTAASLFFTLLWEWAVDT